MSTRLLRRALPWAAALAAAVLPPIARAEFNYEVGLRVEERLTEFLSTPADILDFVANYQTNGALATSDRDAFLLLGDALMKSYPHWMIYYGLESGELAGNFHTPRDGNYREPGNGGYEVGNSVESDLHYMTCVAANGTTVPCAMNPGDLYIKCINDCELQRCENEESQRDCSILEGDERLKCEKGVTWCEQYEITSITEEDGPRGFIPLNELCLDKRGLPSQEVGAIYKSHDGEAGSCYFDDKETLVNRKVTGNYRYCETLEGHSALEGSSQSCDSTFDGAFRIWNYDPRYRPWYIDAKAKQRNYWTLPFHFWDPPDMGVTYVNPIYKTDDQNRRVFHGVLALDYKFLDIAKFLSTSYAESETVIVAIIEESSPYNVIATSNGGIGSKKVLSSDETQLCPDDTADCKNVRQQVDELGDAVSEAFAGQLQAGFPQTRLLPITTEDGVYASQAKRFTLPAQESINWWILILSPIEANEGDAILTTDPVASAIIGPSIFGFLACSGLLTLYIRRRHRREIAYSDWRFTGLFIFNCMLMNLACLSLLGGNTDELCMLRMWMLHFFFVLVFAPLFVKTYRMYLLVGGTGFRRRFSHTKTAVMMIPFIAVEILILLIFSFVDPSKETPLIEEVGSVVTYRVVCAQDTAAFFAVQLIYEGGLVLVGCYLSYKTRNLDDQFGEAKQILVSMYNIATVSSLVIIVANAAEVYSGTLRIFVTVGVAWTTVFSSGVFVVPRLMQLNQRPTGGRSTISGVSAASMQRASLGQTASRQSAVASQNSVDATNRTSEATMKRKVSFDDETPHVKAAVPCWAEAAVKAVDEENGKVPKTKVKVAEVQLVPTSTPNGNGNMPADAPLTETEDTTTPDSDEDATEAPGCSPVMKEEAGGHEPDAKVAGDQVDEQSDTDAKDAKTDLDSPSEWKDGCTMPVQQHRDGAGSPAAEEEISSTLATGIEVGVDSPDSASASVPDVESAQIDEESPPRKEGL